jgi:hypothetical protein
MVFWHQAGTNRHFDLAQLNGSRPYVRVGRPVAGQSIRGNAGYGRDLVWLWRRCYDSLFHHSDKVDDDVALLLGEPIVLMAKYNEYTEKITSPAGGARNLCRAPHGPDYVRGTTRWLVEESLCAYEKAVRFPGV